VLYNGDEVENFGQIAAVTDRTLSLQCLGHAPSNVLDMVWISEEVEQAPLILREDSMDNYTRVYYDYNVANLTVDNLIRPFRGVLKCQAASSNRQITIYVTESERSSYFYMCQHYFSPFLSIPNPYSSLLFSALPPLPPTPYPEEVRHASRHADSACPFLH
jgi:hypothetical protein